MFVEILLSALFGFSLGLFAGLIPGIHPNTIMVIIGSSAILSGTASTECILAFVASLSVTNSIVNFIPSVLTGAPESDTCLSVLPAHRFLMSGRGYEALYLTVAGGVFVTLLTVVSLPFLLWAVPGIYSLISGYMHWLLIAVLLVLLINTRSRRALSLFVFIITGISGLLLLSTFHQETVLFPSLTGLFAVPVLALSAGTFSFPKQKIRTPKNISMKGGFSGWLSGIFVGMLPGIGSAQAAVLSNSIVKGNERDFMMSIGGINTSNVMFSFVMLFTLSKTRTGASAFISGISGAIDIYGLSLLMAVSVLSCMLAAVFTLYAGRLFTRNIHRVNYRKMNFTIVAFLVAITFIITGIYGLLIMVLCSLIGVCSSYMGVKRMYMMGFLMLPTIIYFSGLGDAASLFSLLIPV